MDENGFEIECLCPFCHHRCRAFRQGESLSASGVCPSCNNSFSINLSHDYNAFADDNETDEDIRHDYKEEDDDDDAHDEE